MDFAAQYHTFAFEYYGIHGITDAEYDELKWAIRLFGVDTRVALTIMRRIDPDRMTHCGIKISYFCGRRCVWVALPGICIVFELRDVKPALLRRLEAEGTRIWLR